MCFTSGLFTKQAAKKYAATPLIAKSDIPVWKELVKIDKVFWSPFYGMRYDKGYCYYMKKRIKPLIADDWYGMYVVLINEGLHSYIEKRIKLGVGREQRKMYIPKGAKYYKNKTEYVSSQLTWY